MNETPLTKSEVPPTRQVTSFWKEIGCFVLFYIGLLTTCLAILTMVYSAEVFYHGHFTTFHIVSIAIILINGSVTGMLVLQYPFK